MTEFETYLIEQVNEGIESRTKEAMSYSLTNGGKRIRPALCFALARDFGLDETIAYPCGCAIEMIHTYSLIHDDLPCMDDDDLRRGKPSCHKAYDEATAVLAGDGLLTKAFEVVLKSDVEPVQKVRLVQALSAFAGADGMIFGQDQDMAGESLTDPGFADLLQIETYKTGCLLALPLVCACILAGKDDQIAFWKQFGIDLGILFQIQDDLFDVTKSSEELGKSTSDADNDKMTAVSLLGLEQTKITLKQYEDRLKKMLQDAPSECRNVSSIVEKILNRNN